MVPVKKWSSAIGQDHSMSHPLISVDELRDALGTGEAPVTVLDVRYRVGGPGGPDEYAAGHVPGAAYVDLDLDLAAPPGERGRHPLPEPFRFVNAMRAVGVRTDRQVVVYDDWAGRAAARCWWLLRHYGHPDVRVLDGGWSAWRAAGGDVETVARPVPEGDSAGAPGRLPVVEADEVPGFGGVLVDARAPERFRGDVEPIDPVAGHVPGAVNVPTEDNLRPDGTFRPAEELRARYPEGPVAAYCGSGVTATHDLLALAVAGVDPADTALYPGSWSEWVADPARPVATGPD
jgi:thiosulfate/3-mercaptopyruvate sulfurtransferase